jgi:molecular chaperone DnaK (HSP70)
LSEPIDIGLDFGSLRGRLAYLSNAEIITPPMPPDWVDPHCWIFCESVPALMTGMQFATFKGALGIQVKPHEEREGLTTTLERRFHELKQHLKTQTGCATRQLVIAVPALYPGYQREALHNIATQSGIPKVHLLNDSMAAVIAHTHKREMTSTILVYGMGYGGYEIGLIRVAKKHLSTLAYRGESSPSGAYFDAIIMQNCLQAFNMAGLWSPSQDLSSRAWLRLRDWAQKLKEAMSSKREVSEPLKLGEAGWHDASISVLASAFEHSIRPAIEDTLLVIKGILQEVNLSPADVDELLVVGGSTRIPLLQDMLADRFSRKPVILDDLAIVRGAAIYSSQLGLNAGLPQTDIAKLNADGEQTPAPAAPLPPLKIHVETPAASNTDTDAPRGRSETSESNESNVQKPPVIKIVSPEASSVDNGARESRDGKKTLGSIELGLAHRQKLFEYAHQLIDQGYYERAIGYLQSIAQDAQALLATIAAPKLSSSSREVEEILRSSYELLTQGRYQQAVEESHRAHTLDSETPSVFQQMIDIHCEAAMSNSSVEGYPKAMEWLMCAYQLNRTNQMIHKRIAERHFIHAQQIKQSKEAALRALEECLHFNPDHQGAVELQQILTAVN